MESPLHKTTLRKKKTIHFKSTRKDDHSSDEDKRMPSKRKYRHSERKSSRHRGSARNIHRDTSPITVLSASDTPKSGSDDIVYKHDPVKRLHIIKEIIYTEEHYNSALKTLKKEYRQPLIENNFLPLDSITKLFSPSLSSVVLISDITLPDEPNEDSIDNYEIGPLFLKMMDSNFEKSYYTFISGYEESEQVFKYLIKHNLKFSQFIKSVQKKEEFSNHTIQDYLITVIQRLPHYKLLLSNLLKCTPPEYQDNQYLKESLERVSTITNMINELKKQTENRRKLLLIHTKLGIKEDDIPKTREFVLEENLYEENLPNPQKKKDGRSITLYLFTDSIIIAKFTAEKLDNFKQYSPPSTTLSTPLEPIENAVTITGRSKTITLYCRSKAAQHLILESLKLCE